ncbi:hypothetical protein IC582_017788 [Cucumis melo]
MNVLFIKYCCLVPYVVVVIAMMGESCLGGSKTMPPFSSWKVVVFNQLSPGQSLTVHCKSKDNDLGEHSLRVSEKFSWKFKENLFSTTRFWCGLTSSSKKTVTMDVFWPERHDWLAYRCNYATCIWVAQDDGIYIVNVSTNLREFVRKWDN